MTSKRRRPWMAVLIGMILVLLLLETALVVGVFASPKTAEQIQNVAASADRTWNGSEGEPGLRTRTATRLHQGYQDWIAPLYTTPVAPSGDPEFSECVDCHATYATTRRFSSVYMNHPLHAELGVACKTCHQQNTHPNPVRPEEATCEACHDTQKKDTCGSCHPPGSLPHFYLLGAPRDAAVECDVCHPTNSFDTTASVPKISGIYNGSDASTCTQCHQETTCIQCHQPPHPSGWVSQHGAEAGQSGLNNCYTCHTGLWCGSRCHSVTSTSPFTKQPLPDVGVRP